MGLCLAGIVVVVRFLYDDGKGLIAFFKKLNLMTIEQESISEMVKMIFDNQEMIQLLLLSLVFFVHWNPLYSDDTCPFDDFSADD